MPLSVHIRLARHKVLAPIVGNVALALSAFLAAACMNGAAMSSVDGAERPTEVNIVSFPVLSGLHHDIDEPPEDAAFSPRSPTRTSPHSVDASTLGLGTTQPP